MIQSDNHRDFQGKEQGTHHGSANPEGRVTAEGKSHYDERANLSGNIQKNTIAHERANLNPNQEQRPDSSNPERNRDK